MRESTGEGLQPPYLLKALHQRASTFHLVHLPCPVQGLFDDVAEVIVVLQGRYDSSERQCLPYGFTPRNISLWHTESTLPISLSGPQDKTLEV